MRSRLRNGAEVRLSGAFTSALLLAGCAADMEAPERFLPPEMPREESPPPLELGLDPSCPGLTLDGIAAEEPLDGLELRLVCGWGPPTAESLLGAGCESSGCTSELAELDAEPSGWDRSVQVQCRSYAVGYREGEILGSARNENELVRLLGPLDTPTEVEVLATLRGFECISIDPAPAGHTAALWVMVDSCPTTMQEILFEVTPEGEMTEIQRGTRDERGVCIGRKPEGLVASHVRCTRDGAIGAHLARAAELEAASVVSFLVLKGELDAHGAPEGLKARVVAAARDEIRHARLVTALARRFGARPAARRVRVSNVRPLEAMARENAVEGCVTETWGALIGLHQANAARSRVVRRVYAGLAGDELRHAALSWDLHAWLGSRLSPAARKSVRSSAEARVLELESGLDSGVTPDLRRELGLPGPARRRKLFASLRRELWSV